MTTYAIGDVQGCFDQLQHLLEHIQFDPAHDRLRFAGDLVNRGPRSLDVLRFVRDLGDAAITVLGNHDLHLLATVYSTRKAAKNDTLDEILGAPDRDELLQWLVQQPLLHIDPDSGMVLTHAGLAPQWDLDTARNCARELETVLRSAQLPAFLAQMYGNEPDKWRKKLQGYERLRFITNAFTRMRYCHLDGRLNFSEKNPPGRQGKGLVPWYALPDRRNVSVPIVFGHWASLQSDRALDPGYGVHHIDSGCVWGGTLTALREHDAQRFTVPGWIRTKSAKR